MRRADARGFAELPAPAWVICALLEFDPGLVNEEDAVIGAFRRRVFSFMAGAQSQKLKEAQVEVQIQKAKFTAEFT